jgi:bifunctional DNase/RNase
MRQIIFTLAVVVSSPALAGTTVTFPINIPSECVELAQREGVPIVISNKYQFAKAKIHLARLKDRDPMVRGCREAVDRARQSAGR